MGRGGERGGRGDSTRLADHVRNLQPLYASAEEKTRVESGEVGRRSEQSKIRRKRKRLVMAFHSLLHLLFALKELAKTFWK